MRALRIAAITAWIFFPVFAHAQIVLPGIEHSVTVKMTPNYPAPGDTVHIELQSPILDLTHSTITWYKDGVLLSQAADTPIADVVAGPLGTQMTIEADVHTFAGEDATANLTIVPTQLDVLYDSDAYVPPFYRGRTLASPGTRLHLQAVTRFKPLKGPQLTDSQILYTWKQNGALLNSVSGRGKNAISIDTSPLENNENITVRAESVDGSFINESTIDIPLQKLSLLLYVDHPLFGILFNQALPAQSTAPSNDVTIAAIPFFAPAQSMNDPSLEYAWSVNDSEVVSTSTTHSEIELGASTQNSLANIKLTLTSGSNVFFSISNAWTLLFSPTGRKSQTTTANNGNRFLTTGN